MRWTIIKKGSDALPVAPPIVDKRITEDWVAIQRGKEVLYSNLKQSSIKILYQPLSLDSVVAIGGQYYRVVGAKVSGSDLPYMTVTLERLESV
jgi:hypothetical protein